MSFPHVLIAPSQLNNNTANIVSDESPVGHIFLVTKTGPKDKTITVSYRVDEILEQRPARGNWKRWPVHPNWYKVKTSLVN